MARKLRQVTFELPCGYIDEKDEIHNSMTVHELDHKTDKRMSDSMTSAELLAFHTVQLGSFKDKDELKKVVKKLEKGDFDWALIQIRILSLGPEYEYRHVCPNSRKCTFEGTYEFDMENIEVVNMPDPRIRTFEFETAENTELVFRTLKAEDMEDLAEMMEDNDDQVSKILALQLVSVDGVTPEKQLRDKGRKCKNSAQHVREAITMISKAEVTQGEKERIRKGLRGIRGYPDLHIRQTCPKCGTNFGHHLPIDYTFIAPSLQFAIQHGSL